MPSSMYFSSNQFYYFLHTNSDAPFLDGSLLIMTVIVIFYFSPFFNYLLSLLFREHEMVGYANRMAFPEGAEDNISQHLGSTVHDDDFQEAINMISDDVERSQGIGNEEKVDLGLDRTPQ